MPPAPPATLVDQWVSAWNTSSPIMVGPVDDPNPDDHLDPVDDPDPDDHHHRDDEFDGDEPPMLTTPDILGGLGRLFVGVGAVLVLFALYQVWGSGLLEWRAQRALDARFEASMVDHGVRHAGAGVTIIEREGSVVAAAARLTLDGSATRVDGANLVGGPSTTAAVRLAPVEGEAIGRIEIPAIGMAKTIVEGVSRPTLRNGPGHYPTTPLPGHRGNVAIAGHRTTHGAPFIDLDLLEPGHEIVVETVEGRFVYEVEAQPDGTGGTSGHLLVDPSAVEVIGDRGDDRLTLTACHPKYSARQRIVVTALLVGAPIDTPPPAPVALPLPSPDGWAPQVVTAQPAGPAPAARIAVARGPGGDVDPGATLQADDQALDESLGWQADEVEPVVLWATMTALMTFAGWVLGRLWRRRPARIITTVSVVAPLFACFVHLDRLLPAF